MRASGMPSCSNSGDETVKRCSQDVNLEAWRESPRPIKERKVAALGTSGVGLGIRGRDEGEFCCCFWELDVYMRHRWQRPTTVYVLEKEESEGKIDNRTLGGIIFSGEIFLYGARNLRLSTGFRVAFDLSSNVEV